MPHFSSSTGNILDIPLEILRFIGEKSTDTDDKGNIIGVEFNAIVEHFKDPSNPIIQIHNDCFTYEAIVYGYLSQLWDNQDNPNLIQKVPVNDPTDNWARLIQTNTARWMISNNGSIVINVPKEHNKLALQHLSEKQSFNQPFQNVLTHFKHLQSTAKDLACIRIATRPDYSIGNSETGEFLTRFMYGQSLDAQGRAQLAGDQVLNTLSQQDDPNSLLNKSKAKYSITETGLKYLRTFHNKYEIKLDDKVYFTIHFNVETGQCDVIDHHINLVNPVQEQVDAPLPEDRIPLTITNFYRHPDAINLDAQHPTSL